MTNEPAPLRLRPGPLTPGYRQFTRDLMAATQRGGFVLMVQPRVRLEDGVVLAAEATLRWPHRHRGLLTIAAIAPLAERLGVLERIGGWLLAEACAAAVRWPEPMRLAVRIGVPQLTPGQLARHISAALEQSGLSADRLDLELPESLPLHDDAEALLILAGLRDLGVGLVLDEFGAAAGSVTALRHLPLTAVKLDRALVRNLPADAEDMAIVRALAATAAALDIELWAEGIETEAQRAALVAAGCRQGQGYLFGGPAPADQVAANTRVAPSA